MTTPRRRKPFKSTKKKNLNTLTLIEQKDSIYSCVIEGVELGLNYTTIANGCGVAISTLSSWFGLVQRTELKFEALGLSDEEVIELSNLNGDLIRDRKKYVEKYGEGVVTLVEEEGFWLKLAYDLKKADGRAETKMLGVIRGAAIGNHKVCEIRKETINLKRPGKGSIPVPAEKIITTTKEIPPRWQAAAWFLERKWPEKYAQRKIVEGELPKGIPYEVFMTAKLLLQLPKTELDRITSVLKDKMRPKVIEMDIASQPGKGNQ